MFWLKVLDLLWFDNSPATLDDEFEFSFNRNWPNLVDHPPELLRLGRLGLPELINRLDRPAWVANVPTGKFSLRPFLKMWQSTPYEVKIYEENRGKIVEGMVQAIGDKDNQSWMQLCEDFIRTNIPKPGKPFTLEELKFSGYQFKVLDSLWFNGDAPDSLNKVFQFYLNDNWPNPVDHPEELFCLSRLGFPELVHLSKRIKKPNWVAHAPIGKLTFAEYLEIWKNISYRPKG
jgi:hypothetical protein